MLLNKKNLILHIGTIKTGTTSIQHFLNINRRLLSSNGFYYPNSIGSHNHQKLAFACMDDHKTNQYLEIHKLTERHKRDSWKEEILQNFDTELGSLGKNIGSVIISSEHFIFHLTNEDELKELYNLLKKRFSQIKVIVYLRRQDMLMISHYSTICKAGKVKTEILSHRKKVPSTFNYNNLLRKWSSVFGKLNIQVEIYDPETFVDNNVIYNFIQQCGLPDDLKYKFPVRANESLSATTQDVIQLFNKKYEKHLQGNAEVLKSIRDKLIDSINSKYPGRGKLPTQHEAKEFYSRFVKSNNKVANKWFGRDNLFPDDFSMYPEQPIKERDPLEISNILESELKAFKKKLKKIR